MKVKLAKILTEYMKTVSLEEITVKKIIEKAGVSRQTFYYYFHDIYEVLEWYLGEEIKKIIKPYSGGESWIEGYASILKWAKENKSILMNIYNSVRRDTIEFYMCNLFYDYVIKAIRYKARNRNVSAKQQELIADFYTMGLNAVTLEWMRTNMKEDPEQLAKKVYIMLQGNCERSLINFENNNQKIDSIFTDAKN